MTFLQKLKASRLARDTSHLAIGQGLRLVIQTAYLVLIARSLGPEEYGAFVAVVALAAILSPFSGLGYWQGSPMMTRQGSPPTRSSVPNTATS